MSECSSSEGELRLFVAVLLPGRVRDGIAATLLPPLRPLLPRASWVRPDNLHVTVKFIGAQPASAAPAFAVALHAAAAASRPFDLTLGGVGAFPSLQRPRVVWLGADPEGEAAATELARRVDEACARLGVERERRRFRAHVTLARVRPGRDRSDRAGAVPEEDELARAARRLTSAWPLHVADVALVRSELGPGGSRYTVLHRFPLGGRPAT